MAASGSFIALLILAAPALADAPRIVKHKGHLDFMVGKQLVASYLTGETLAKPIFWPLNPVEGKSISRAWPMIKDADEKKDHPHQASLWFCHGDIIPTGIKYPRSGDKKVKGVDFWSIGKNHGKIVCVEVGEPKNGKVVTKNEWRTAEGTKIMDETRTLSLRVVGKGFLIEMESELKASVCDLTFGDTKEGALGVRVRKTVSLTTSKGKGQMVDDKGRSGEAQVWGKVANWCDYSGPLGEGGPVGGVTLMAYPGNKYDTAWHARGYGLMAANPFGRSGSFPGRKGNTKLVKIARGGSLLLNYGIYLHEGNARDGKVAEAYAAFSKLKP